MKKILLILSLLIITSCASTVSSTQDRGRYVSTISTISFKSCISAIRNIYRPYQKSPDSVAYLSSFKQYFRDHKASRQPKTLAIPKGSVFGISENPFLKDLGNGIALSLEKRLRKIDKKYVSYEESRDILDDIIVQKLSRHKLNLDSLDLVNRLFYAGYTEKEIVEILSKSFYDIPAGLSPYGFVLGEIVKDLNSFNLKSFKKFLKQVSYAPLNNREVDEIINKITEHLHSTGRIHLASALKEAMKERSIFDTNYIFKNLINVLEFKDNTKIKSKDLTSGLELLAAIKSGRRIELEKIKFAHSLDESSLEKLRDLIPQLDKRLSYRKMARQITQEIPKIKYKKLISLDYYVAEVQTHRVYSQCNWGSCWVQSPIAKFETEISNALKKEVNISTDYFYMKIYLAKVIELLRSKSAEKDLASISEGGFSATVDAYAQLIGFMPEQAWKPKKQFHNRENKFELMEKLEKIIEGKSSTDQKEKLVYKLFDEMFGIPPKKFNFEGQEYTAVGFYEKFRKYSMKDIVIWSMDNIANDYKHSLKKAIVYQDGVRETSKVFNKIIKKTKEEVDERIIASIDDGKPVGASFKWLSRLSYGEAPETPFVNVDTGVMSAPKIHPDNELKDKKYGGHMVLIIGYDLDEEGGIKTYKILNSWGNKRGDNGIYHMDKNYFNNYLRGLYLNKKTLLGTIEIKKAQYYWASI